MLSLWDLKLVHRRCWWTQASDHPSSPSAVPRMSELSLSTNPQATLFASRMCSTEIDSERLPFDPDENGVGSRYQTHSKQRHRPSEPDWVFRQSSIDDKTRLQTVKQWEEQRT